MQKIVENILDKELANSSLFLIETSVVKNRVEVYIEGDNGISLDDCTRINLLLHKRLEEQNIDTGSYFIDVSSPGIGRLITRLREYKKNVGRKIELRNNQNRIVKGILTYVDSMKIALNVGKNINQIFTFTEIKEAKVTI
ncbi:MAG: hypothetical protein NTX03_02830 [Bacteroidetes bacterium]|nr:hypothetical protein [Bacteroidota bacterium]